MARVVAVDESWVTRRGLVRNIEAAERVSSTGFAFLYATAIRYVTRNPCAFPKVAASLRNPIDEGAHYSVVRQVLPDGASA